jgi:ER degradation enhancer, mannosidase alpha-like 1
MKRRWPETLLAVLVISLEAAHWSYSMSAVVQAAPWTTRRKLDSRCVSIVYTLRAWLRLAVCRERTRDLWYHGFDSYMQYGTNLHFTSRAQA